MTKQPDREVLERIKAFDTYAAMIFQHITTSERHATDIATTEAIEYAARMIVRRDEILSSIATAKAEKTEGAEEEQTNKIKKLESRMSDMLIKIKTYKNRAEKLDAELSTAKNDINNLDLALVGIYRLLVDSKPPRDRFSGSVMISESLWEKTKEILMKVLPEYARDPSKRK